jgi:hypothetical protein
MDLLNWNTTAQALLVQDHRDRLGSDFWLWANLRSWIYWAEDSMAIAAS